MKKKLSMRTIMLGKTYYQMILGRKDYILFIGKGLEEKRGQFGRSTFKFSRLYLIRSLDETSF